MIAPPQPNKNVAAQQNTAVMDQVRKQRAPAPDMEVLDILKQTVGGRGGNPVAAYNTLAKLVNTNPDFRIMRANNTLFAYNNNRDGSIDVSIETVDSPRNLVESFKEFGKAAKVAGFRQVRFPVGNPQILKAIKIAGYEPKTQSTGGFMEDGKTPAMTATVEI
jgi:hypothetical protein